MFRYPGGKNSSFRTIINEIPPHRLYVEPFLGSGAVFRNKRAADSSILSDLCPSAISAARSSPAFSGDRISVAQKCAFELLPSLPPSRQTVVYCDPPYLPSTRSDPLIYDFEMSEEDHDTMLSILLSSSNTILLSGYKSPLYAARLSHWRRVDYVAGTRQGPVVESLWCNFDTPTALHDYSHLGLNTRAREKITRQQRRWRQRLDSLPPLERAAMLEVLTRSGV